MRARTLGVLVAGALVAAGLPLVTAAAPAAALEAPVAFTATALDTYQTDGIVWATASAQGKVFVGGSFSHLRPPRTAQGDPGEVVRSNLAVLDAATGEPTSCAPAALLGTDPATQVTGATVRSLAVSPDGETLYVGGFFSTLGGVARGAIAALDIASCTVVPGWSPNATGTVRAIAATASTVYFGGQFVSVASGATPRLHAAAAVAVGQPSAGSVTAWDPSTTSTVDPVRNLPDVNAIVVKPGGGEVIIGGDFEKVGGTASHALAAVDPASGALVWALDQAQVPWAPSCASNVDPQGYSSNVKALAADASGFYTGNEGTGCGSFDGRTKWSWDHELLWKNGCLGATQGLSLYAGALYSVSHAHNCTSIDAFPDGARRHILADTLDARGDSDPAVSPYPYPALLPFFPNTDSGDPAQFPRETGLEGIGPRAVTVAATAGQDYLYVVGEFTTVNGVAQQGITRFGQTSNAQPSLPLLSLSSTVPGQVRIAWRPSLDLDDAGLTYTLQRSDTGSAPWTTLQTADQTTWFWDRPQMSYTDTGRTIGSTPWYRVSVSDGTVTRTTSAKPIAVTNVGTDLGAGAYGPSPYESAVLADSPELYVRYDETGDVFLSDRSGNAGSPSNRNNLVYQGAVPGIGSGLVTSDSSRSWTVSGTQVLYSQKRVASPADYTLETWFSTTTTTGGKLLGFGDKQEYASTNYDKMVWMTNAGRLVFGVAPGGSKVRLITPDGTFYNDGQRHHLVAVQSASTGMAIYVDGVLVASNSTKSNKQFRGYWHVGGDNLSSWVGISPYTTSSYSFAGTLDETAVYHSALSPARIAAHYAARDQAGTTVVDLTPQKPTVTIGSPADGASVKGVVSVSVAGGTTPGTTSHPVSLQLVVDGTPTGTPFDCGSTGDSCSTTFDWDTANLSLGAHTLAARITSTGPSDSATSAAIDVTVLASLDPQEPTVTIDQPVDGEVVGPGTVEIHASASTVTGTTSYPASLGLYVDGVGPLTSAPCSGTTYDCSGVLTWDATGLSGAHSVAVMVTATSECEAVAGTCTATSAASSVSVAAPTRTTVAALTTLRAAATVTVKGTVVVPVSGAAAGGMTVQVTATPAVGAPVTKTTTTASNGTFAVPFAVTMNTMFAATAQTSGWRLGSTSASVRQAVAPIPACSVSASTVRLGTRVTVTCRRADIPAGTAASVQYKSTLGWRTLVKGTSRTGYASLSYVLPRRGYWYLRGVIGSTPKYGTSVGYTLRVRVI